MDEARQYGLDVLAEVHDENDLRRAVAAGANLVGINNRNLRTLETDLAVPGSRRKRIASFRRRDVPRGTAPRGRERS